LGFFKKVFSTIGSCLTSPIDISNLHLDGIHSQDGSNINPKSDSPEENLSSNRNSISPDNQPKSQESVSEKAKGKRPATQEYSDTDNGGSAKKPRLDQDDSGEPVSEKAKGKRPATQEYSDTDSPRRPAIQEDSETDSPRSPSPSSGSPSPSFEEGYETDSNRSYFEEGAQAMVNHPVDQLPEDQLRRYITDTDEIIDNPALAGVENDSRLRQQWADRNNELRQELSRRMDEGMIPRDNGSIPTSPSSLTTTVPASTSTASGLNAAQADNRSPLDFVLDKQSSEPMDISDTED
jgi:hypothetical protein